MQEFLVGQGLVTRTRRAFDRALCALPITQHERIWQIYLVSMIQQRSAALLSCMVSMEVHLRLAGQKRLMSFCLRMV